MLVPAEGLLAAALVRAVAFIVAVHVDQAVALLHLAGGEAHHVDAAPDRVAHDGHAVQVDGLLDLGDVALEVFDARVVGDVAVLVGRLVHAHAVLDDEQRLVPALVHLAQRVAQADRIDLPAPVGGLDVRVGHQPVEAVLHRVERGALRADGYGHVVAQGDVVDDAVLDSVEVARLHCDVDAVTLPPLEQVARILAVHVHVAEQVALAHLLLGEHDVVRAASLRIDRHEGEHAADLEVRVDLASALDRDGRGDELVVNRLPDLLLHLVRGVVRVGDDAGVRVREDRRVHVHLVVDLVEGQPVGHQVLVALHHRGGEAHEAVDDLAVGEAAHLGQVQGHFEVGEGDDRLHALGAVVGEQLFVELESGLVRLLFVAVRKNAGPGDGCAEALEAHFPEQRIVLAEGVIIVDAAVVRVVEPVDHAVGDLAGHASRPAGEYVADARAAAVHVPCAFKLMCGDRAAPEEILGKSHDACSFTCVCRT